MVANYITKLRGLKPHSFLKDYHKQLVANYITKLRGLKRQLRPKSVKADFRLQIISQNYVV